MRSLAAAVVAACMLSACVVVTERPPPQGDDPGRGQGSDSGGQRYDFLHTRANGEPMRWNTCEPIRYVIREANEPKGARRVLRNSIRRIAEATDMKWSFQGTTTEAPGDKRRFYNRKRYGDQWAPVLIAYSHPGEYPRLKGQAVGYGGAAFLRPGDATPRYVTGMAVFDTEQMTGLGGRKAMRAVMLHELAHVAGLGHVENRGQLMNPVQYGRGITELQKGDLAGLRVLGNGECYEPLEPRPIRR